MAPGAPALQHARVLAAGPLVCAVDCDDRAPALIGAARAWAAAIGLTARFAHVLPDEPARADAGARTEAALTALGIRPDELTMAPGDAVRDLPSLIRAQAPALVFVGASGREVPDAFANTVCGALIRELPCPVAVLPPGASESTAGPIACAVSVGDADETAVRFANALAGATGRRLVLAHVVRPQDAARLAASRATLSLQHTDPPADVAARLDDTRRGGAAGVARHVGIRGGVLAERVLDVTHEAGADAVVIAARTAADGGGVAASVAQRLWTAASCPVFFVAGD